MSSHCNEKLFTAMREHGYTEPEFFQELKHDETGTLPKLMLMLSNGQSTAAWREIERLHDEFVFFSIYGDDDIVMQEV